MKNVLVLFDQEWDHAQLRKASEAAGAAYRFFYEGFDLFRFPSNARLLTFDIFGFVQSLTARYRNMRLDAVVSSHEQFGALAASLLAERLGLPGTRLAAVLDAQHKERARQRWQAAVPHLNVPFQAFPYTVRHPQEIALPFPLYVKPVKAAYSVLARQVGDFAELRRHLSFRPWEKFIIKRLVRPFNDVVARVEEESADGAASGVNGHWMIGEEIVDGFQVNVDGYALNGDIHLLGIVDAVMYPGTDAFLRWEYPSRLPVAWQDNIRRAAREAMAALQFDHGLFNVELRVCTHSGTCKIIEVNPRMAAQFSDLYDMVDGINLHTLALELALGKATPPTPDRRAGRYRVATSFVYRRFDGLPQPHFPDAAARRTLAGLDPDAQLITFEKRGNALRREMRWLKSYRYACLNMGAGSEAELREKYERASAILGFPAHAY